MKLAYTVCTLNRLGQAIVLAESLLKKNQKFKFFVTLADELNGEINPENYPYIQFVNFSDLKLKNSSQLIRQYDLFELSCALKPYFGNYLLAKYSPDILIYLDTDIFVYNSFTFLENLLKETSIVITPHFLKSPPKDGKFPLERDVLNSGLYNGGFFAIKNSAVSQKFLEWWKNRVENEGYNNVCEGMMVDQLWLNLVPLYFESVKILDHPGYNFAYWNMHERVLQENNGEYYVNNYPLIFFHFSGFKINTPNELSIHQNRYIVKSGTVLEKIIIEYSKKLFEANYEGLLKIPCFYKKLNGIKRISFPKKIIISFLNHFGYSLNKIRKI